MSSALKKPDMCSLEHKQQALQRALESRTFRRSEQMRSFLQYVCEAEFRGEGSALNEYIIGTEVLHRPQGYSPAEDSSVRTRAYELRQKLERLYAEELTGEELRIVIPRGAYTPEFVRYPASPDVESGTVTSTESSDDVPEKISGVARPTRWKSILLLALGAGIFMVAGYLIPRQSLAKSEKTGAAPFPIDPLVKEAWAQVAKPNSQALLVPATPLYLVLGPETHHAYGTLTYPAPPEGYALFRNHRPLPKNGRLGMLFTDDALGVGSMDAVVIASNTIRILGGDTEILPERASMMPALHGRDVVLFGAPVDSEVISEILETTPLTVDYDENHKEFVIRDRANGQVLAPEMTSDGDFRSVYGLVTVLNTRESEHGGLGTIVFSGITSVGTHGAAEYFASPRSLKTLLEIFAKSGVSRFPAAYQVVVKCKIENLLLISEEYETHRILQNE